jgi:hypothetical protein
MTFITNASIKYPSGDVRVAFDRELEVTVDTLLEKQDIIRMAAQILAGVAKSDQIQIRVSAGDLLAVLDPHAEKEQEA